jgi:hypothetical protein
MIKSAILIAALSPTAGSAQFECQLQKPDQQVATISGDFDFDHFSSDVFATIGDDRPLVSTNVGGGAQIVVYGHGKRYSWIVSGENLPGYALPRYHVDLLELPGGTGHLIITRIQSDGGRHSGEVMLGFGRCDFKYPEAEAAQQ